MEEKIFLNENEEYITLNILLKIVNLISTGGQAKFFLQENEVFVNDELEQRRGRKLYDGTVVRVGNSKFLIRKR